MAQLELISRTPEPTSATSDATDRLEEMLGRYLGPVILDAISNPDVTDVYVNPQDCVVRLDTHSRGKIDSGATIEAHRIGMFLNAVATRLGVTLTSASPRLEAELPTRVFSRARLQGFVPPVTPGPAFNIRKPARSVYTLDDYVTGGVLPRTNASFFERQSPSVKVFLSSVGPIRASLDSFSVGGGRSSRSE
jgi:type IV secretion system protein VirB11